MIESNKIFVKGWGPMRGQTFYSRPLPKIVYFSDTKSWNLFYKIRVSLLATTLCHRTLKRTLILLIWSKSGEIDFSQTLQLPDLSWRFFSRLHLIFQPILYERCQNAQNDKPLQIRRDPNVFETSTIYSSTLI